MLPSAIYLSWPSNANPRPRSGDGYSGYWPWAYVSFPTLLRCQLKPSQAGTVSIICFVVWRESYAPILLSRKAARLRKSTGNPSLRSKYDKGLSDGDQFKHSIGRAIKILIYSPVVLTLSLYMGLVYAYFYLLFTTLTRVFEENYGFDSSIVGLSYLGVGLGFLVAQVSYARLGDEIMRRMTKKSGSSEMKPEYRLPLCIVGGMLVPIGLFWYGWSVEKRIHWIMPIIGTGVMGMGNCLIFVRLVPSSPRSLAFGIPD